MSPTSFGPFSAALRFSECSAASIDHLGKKLFVSKQFKITYTVIIITTVWCGGKCVCVCVMSRSSCLTEELIFSIKTKQKTTGQY